MKVIAFLVISFINFFYVDLGSIRSAFQLADESKLKADDFYNLIKDYDKKDAVLLAYKGASYTIKARFETNKSKKKELFTNGARTIESAVASAPKNIEVRLVRLIIQENAPKIVKYNKNIEEDKKLIIDNFSKQSVEIKNAIRSYAKRSNILSDKDLKD